MPPSSVNIHPLWAGCVLFRAALVAAVYFLTPNKYTRALIGLFLLAVALGFLYRGVFGSNRESQFAKVFWHSTRLVHFLFYACATVLWWLDKQALTSLVLLSDVLFSIVYRIYLITYV